MGAIETRAVRWLFDTESSPSSETQADELAHGIFDRADSPSPIVTPLMWHPSMGVRLTDDVHNGVAEDDESEAVVIQGPWPQQQ